MGKKVVLIIFVILLIDQLVKVWVKSNMFAHEEITLVDGFIQLFYTENRGMAFGTTLGSGAIGKYALSLFRLGAIIAIAFYIRKTIVEGKSPKGLVIALALIFAGASGNLIDGLFYDYIFELDPNLAWNWALDANENYIQDEFGHFELRPHGFLLGSVVDMFRFTTVWPSWMPFGLEGQLIFGAIWNVADFSICIGVILIIVRYKSFFKKQPVEDSTNQAESKESTAVQEHQ